MERQRKATALVVMVALVVTLTQSLVPGLAPAGAELPAGTSLLAWVEAGEIVVAEADGSGRQLLTDREEHGEVGNESAPLWTPDGQAVVGQTSSGFIVADLAGTVTGLPGTGGWWTSAHLGVSPTGTVLGLQSESSLATVPLDGSATPTPIPLGGLSVDRASWSPDGTRIAFSTRCCSPLDTDVYVVNVTGGAPPLLISDGDDFQAMSPVFSPDGTRVAFEAQFPYSNPALVTNSIVVANADGSGTEVGIAPRATSTDNRRPAWSPDSTLVAWSGTVDLGGSRDVFTAPADGSAVPTLRSTGADLWYEHPPTPFAPDSSHLLFRGASGVRVAHLGGGDPTPLLFPGDTWGVAAFDPSGELVAEVTEDVAPGAPRVETTAQLYVTPADGTGTPVFISMGVDTAASWSPLRAPEQEFSDVPTDHPFFTEISWLVAEGITTGFPDGTFKPDRRVNRQAMAAFLYRLAGEPAFTPPGAPSFSDVGASHPFFTEIEWLASTGITGGFPDGTFRPGGEVSRQAMAAFLYRFAGEPAFTPPGTPSFSDVGASHPFFTEIEWLVSTGITGGFSDGGFKPSRGVTRQAMAAFLYRYVDAGLPTGAVT